MVRLLWCLSHGIRVAMWSLDSGDSTVGSVDELVRSISPATVRDGEIVLFHEDSKATVEALPQVLRRLKDTGFAFAAL